MDKKFIATLYRELPQLIKLEVLTPEAAAKLQDHYGPVEQPTQRLFILLFGVLGALLIGLGIISLLAHNWEQFSRLQRLLIAVGLLIVSQLCTIGCSCRKQSSLIFTEAAALVQMLAIGAAMALVGQTYHLTDDTDKFLLTWMVLSLPLAYVLQANSVAILYTIGITSWVINVAYLGEQPWFCLLFLLILPFYLRAWRHRPTANMTVVLSWIWCVSLLTGFVVIFSRDINHLIPLVYSLVFALVFISGVLWFHERSARPFKIIGFAGISCCLFVLASKHYWLYWGHTMTDLTLSPTGSNLLIALLILVIGTNIRLPKQTGLEQRLVALAPLVIGLAYGLDYLAPLRMGPIILISAYLLLLGIAILRAGVNSGRLNKINVGMLIIIIWIAIRFFDSQLSFISRAVIFVGLGIAFIAANWFLLRQKRRSTL